MDTMVPWFLQPCFWVETSFNLSKKVDSSILAEVGHAYKSCITEQEWAEKANYSECLSLISDIPHYEVSMLNMLKLPLITFIRFLIKIFLAPFILPYSKNQPLNLDYYQRL